MTLYNNAHIIFLYLGCLNDDPTQFFETYMKMNLFTDAVVISLHCKHVMFKYINVSHTYTAMHCIISQF